jgi:hypothetical protein
MRKPLLILLVLFGFCAATLSAQDKESEKHKFGLVFSGSGDTPGVGVLWHLNDHIAFSPYINFTHTWANDQSISSLPSPLSSINGNTLGAGAKLQLYLKDWNKVRFYVAPGYRFDRSRSQDSASSSSGTLTTTTYYDNKNFMHRISAVLGVQYPISNRISIFGELGGEYRDYQSKTINFATYSYQASRSTSYDYSTFSAGFKNSLGIILYLK